MEIGSMIEVMTNLRRLDTFGGRLQLARSDAKLSQEELAALLAERIRLV